MNVNLCALIRSTPESIYLQGPDKKDYLVPEITPNDRVVSVLCTLLGTHSSSHMDLI